MWLSTDRYRLPILPQGLAQSNSAVMLGLQMRRAFHRHRAADVHIGASISRLEKNRSRRAVEIRAAMASGARLRVSRRKSSHKGPFVERDLMSKAVGSAASPLPEPHP